MCSGFRGAGTTAGSRKKLPEVSWHCGLGCHGLEVEGIPLDRYLDHFTGLGKQEQHEVISRVMQEAEKSTSSGAKAGVCNRKVARIGVLSWNVGGISDHRKDQGAGLEEEAQAAVADVLQAAVAKLGAADVIVVGLQVRYQVLGENNTGPSCLLLHGLLVNADHWRRNLPDLAKAGLRVYALDFLGSGYTDRLEPCSPEAAALSGERRRNLSVAHAELLRGGGRREVVSVPQLHPLGSVYNIYTWSEQVCDFLEEVVKDDAFLIGNSLGSLIGLQAAIDRPDLARGVLLVNPRFRQEHVAEAPAVIRPFIELVQSLLRETFVGRSLFNLLANKNAVKEILKEPYYDSSQVTDELVDVLLEPLLLQGAPESVFDTFSYSTGPLLEQLLQDSRLAAPVWACWGDKDPWTPLQRASALGELSSVKRLIEFPGVGHCPHDEAPNVVNALILEFTRNFSKAWPAEGRKRSHQGPLEGTILGASSDEYLAGDHQLDALECHEGHEQLQGKNQTFYGWPETVAQWVELLLGALNSRPMPAGKSFCSSDHRAYVLYGQPVYLFGLLLCVFCPAHLLKHIRDFGMAEKPMDPRIKSGSKGAVACRFVLWDRSFCFLNCHLAATTSNSTRYGLRDLKQRLQQLEQCWTEIKFKSLVNQMVYPVPAHRAIFLMGDTNMRLVNRESKKDFHAYALQALGKPEGYKELWKLDQLSQEMADSPQPSLFPQKSLGCLSVPHERLLSQWREPFADAHQGPPFPPTFKLAVPGPGFSKKRVPAWTDRVLFSGEHAEPLKYGSVEQIQVLNPPHNVSDHDPVYAFFEVECMAIHPRRLGTLAREVRSATKEPREEPLARSPTTQLQALQQDQTFGGGMLATNQPDIDEISRKLYEQVTREHFRNGSCAGDIFTTVAKNIGGGTLSEEQIATTLAHGCDPTKSSYSKHCPEVKELHTKAYVHTLQRLNRLLLKFGSVAASFDDFSMVSLYNCIWHNRHNPGDTFGDEPFDTCTEDQLCAMITTAEEYEHQMPEVSLEALRKSRVHREFRGTHAGWPGTGKDFPMVRVSLLHKSDGTAAAPETILGRGGLRLSSVSGGWAKRSTLHLEPKYSEGFQIAWGKIRDGMLPNQALGVLGGPPLHLESGLVEAAPGSLVRNFSDTPVAAKMPPAAGSPITLLVIGDPCNGNMFGGGQCVFRDYYGVNKTLPTLLNAALPSTDVWYLTGDNFYDRYGVFSVSVFAQLEPAAQGVPLLSTPGNHDYWFEGIPEFALDDSFLGYDQFGFGGAQFYAMDTAASWAPQAPQEDLISPKGRPASQFSQAPAFLDLSGKPKEDAKAVNFQHYGIAGNVGFIVITCVGGDPRPFVKEACTFMKQKNPDLVLLLGHWNKPGSGCTTGWDVPNVTAWALDHSDCAAFRGESGEAPYGSKGKAATRMKFIVGHQHCNCMTSFEQTLKDGCLDDHTDPSKVDGFIIGSHGMSWDPQHSPKCSSRFGLPVLRTDGGKLTFAYAKLSLDTWLTHCKPWEIFCKDRPGEVSRTDLWKSWFTFTPSHWSPRVAGPYGKGIIREKMDGLVACLREKGTSECSKDANLFDQWYSNELK
ncbi:INP53 [Symbiodinium microadriaticum]|nr:INP53 [Symbiodinium microadriaticum]